MSTSADKFFDFTLYYNRHKEKVYNYAVKMLNDRNTAEDVLHDVFVKLYDNFDSIRDKERILFWLCRTTRNEIINYWAKNKKISYTIDNDSDEDFNFGYSEDFNIKYENIEFKEILDVCLESIAQRDKEIFLLREFSDLPYKEIAELINADIETVKSRLFRTRAKIFDLIRKRYSEVENELW